MHATIDIVDNDEVHWGSYDLLISFPLEYPNDLPILYEIGGRIKQDANWHRNSDFSCCIGTWVGEMMKYQGEVRFLDWMNRSVYPYLSNQLHKERHGHYANGEYAHDFEGIVQFYREWWNLDLDGIIKRLKLITETEPHTTNERCFCGSGTLYRKCHSGQSKFEGLPRSKFQDSLRLLKWYQMNKRA